MTTKKYVAGGLSAFAAAAVLLLSAPAMAATDVDTGGGTTALGHDYFVRPFIRYSSEHTAWEYIDGIELNGATSRSESFNDGWIAAQSHVDLKAGTIKTYASINGPDSNTLIVSGIMGDVITYRGEADVPVTFNFSYEAQYEPNLVSTGVETGFYDSNQAGVEAFFGIYEASSDAYWQEWDTRSVYTDQALHNEHDEYYTNVQAGPPEEQGQTFDNWLGTELYLQPGKAYKVFYAFNLILSPGEGFIGEMVLDSLHTSTISIDAPADSFTSLSGEFLGFAKTPTPPGPGVDAIPEPATWALMIAGFGLTGMAVRRRRRLPAAI